MKEIKKIIGGGVQNLVLEIVSFSHNEILAGGGCLFSNLSRKRGVYLLDREHRDRL